MSGSGIDSGIGRTLDLFWAEWLGPIMFCAAVTVLALFVGGLVAHFAWHMILAGWQLIP